MKKFARFLGIGNDKDSSEPGLSVVPAQAEMSATAEMPSDNNTLEVQQIPIDEISPNPFQPRKTFNGEALQELAASIAEFGVIQPLLVRHQGTGYELIAGERRLRASKLAGLTEVPVIVKELDDKEMAELAMIENLQREDLHYLEEAEGFQQLLINFGFTQEELAKRVGKNQSTIANKLRILKLPAEIRAALTSDNLTERHARALLKVEDSKLQMEVLEAVRQKGLNVRETEELIDDISREMSKKKSPRQNIVKVIRDVRIFINTINKVVEEMKKSGLKIKVDQKQDEEYITINLRIPKRR